MDTVHPRVTMAQANTYPKTMNKRSGNTALQSWGRKGPQIYFLITRACHSMPRAASK